MYRLHGEFLNSLFSTLEKNWKGEGEGEKVCTFDCVIDSVSHSGMLPICHAWIGLCAVCLAQQFTE